VNWLIVAVLFGLMRAIRTFAEASPSSIGVSVALGYLLLTGFFVGRIFASIGLPKLTGYLVTGLVVGPAALGLVDNAMVESLTIVNGMAVALIALTAGLELEFGAMRPLFRTIRWITLVGILGTAVLLALAVLAMKEHLPFLAGMGTTESLVIAAVLAVVMVAQSPAVVVALKNEMLADGPVSRTALGVVVIADLVVILLFALVSSVAKSVLGSGSDLWATVGALVWELLGSLVVGGVLGYVLAFYMRRVRAGASLFVLTLVFVMAEVGRRLHFDPLLVALSAGIVVRNLTTTGDKVHLTIEETSLPVYVLFFTVAGTSLHLDVLATVGFPAAVFVLVRGCGLLVGSRIGARLAGASPEVQKFAGFGLLPQAGLALALSMLFAKTFPEFGEAAGALTLSVVALNEILAPVAFRIALVRSGEAGKRAAPPSGASGH
jgi:Kef-type K+ transport system membrane component KefB